ncbi:MAG TPA: HEAT repeat domain-containing protein [Actinomycetota bacterium]
MTALDEYRRALKDLDDPEPFLLERSCLPGRGATSSSLTPWPTSARASSSIGSSHSPRTAPRVGSREEFLAFCAAIGFGRLAAEGNRKVLMTLRTLASDPRWRVREGVALGLQRLGASDMQALLTEMRAWATGNDYPRRAAAAALCEPVLLRRESDVREVLAILDSITAALSRSSERRSEGFRALRKGLAYCWSVAVAAAPDAGRPLMERWMRSDDPDVRWVMKQNLTKKRLTNAGADWVASWSSKLGHGS